MKKEPETFSEAVENLNKAFNELILCLGDALYIDKILAWINRRLK